MRRVCSIPGCDRVHEARGWCGAHYNRWRRWGDPEGDPSFRCAADGCDRPIRARAMCHKHYDRWYRQAKAANGDTCEHDGCGKPARTRGWCSTHYNRWYEQHRRDIRTVEPAPVGQAAWMDQAKCRGMDGRLFFHDDSHRWRNLPHGQCETCEEAKATCAGCPVVDRCLEANLGVEWGVFGGTLPEERRRLRRRVS